MSQLDLFIPIAGDVRAKDQQDIMAFPGCSLSKKPRFTKIRFEDSQGSWIEVSPHQDHGMANIWDFDIMLYVVALVRQMKQGGLEKPKIINFRGYDCLKFIGRGDSTKDYEALRDSLTRLKATTVRTNIRLEEVYDPERDGYVAKEEYHEFNWISEWKEHREVFRTNPFTGERQLISNGFEVIFPHWFIDGIWKEENLLAINRDYFNLTSGYERFLYRIARKFCGRQSEWSVSLRSLHQRSGTTASYRQFVRYVKKYVDRGNIPDYDLAVYTNSQGDKRLFTQPWEIDQHYLPPGDVLASSIPILSP